MMQSISDFIPDFAKKSSLLRARFSKIQMAQGARELLPGSCASMGNSKSSYSWMHIKLVSVLCLLRETPLNMQDGLQLLLAQLRKQKSTTHNWILRHQALISDSDASESIWLAPHL